MSNICHLQTSVKCSILLDVMSIHVQLSDEAKAKLKRQSVASTVTSLIISILSIALIGCVLGLLVKFIPDDEPPVMISYSAPATTESEESSERQVQTNRSNPTPQSSSAMANVMTSVSASAVSIPTTEKNVDVESMDFGDLDDFGGDFADDSVMADSTFFGAQITGDRICYVIDYSLSMRSQGRVELMKEELSNSISQLEGGAEFNMLFFAGPVWQSSDKIVLKEGERHAIISKTIQEDGKEVTWTGVGSTKESELAKLKPTWVKPTSANIKKALKEIKENPLVLGTEWGKPLRKAFELKPTPDVIVFMTDGSGGNEKTVEEIGKIANKKSIVVNTIALMEPNARGPMVKLAQMTSGTAIMVEKDGKIIDLMQEGEATAKK